MEPEWCVALDAVVAGDPGPAQAQLADPRIAPAVEVALRAALARALPASFAAPSRVEIEALASGPAEIRDAASIAASFSAREARSRLDAPGLAGLASLAVALAGGERAAIEAASVAAWARLSSGAWAGLREEARAIEARAARVRLAHVVLEAASLAALAALAEGDLDAAIAIARRASRMARTESLPQEEYLAHVVLARVRRRSGRPHLATRILAALARVAPQPWLGWLALELVLSGAPELASRALARATAAPSADGAAALIAIVRTASAGARESLEEALCAARRALAGFPSFASELEALALAIDPLAALPEAGPLAELLRGTRDEVPGELAGPASIPRPGETSAGVRVIAGPGVNPRRVLAIGVALVPGVRELGREAGAKQRRRELALAVLALAGARGITKEELFRTVWGFAFTPHLHQGVLDVLLHRVRAALGDAGELSREGARFTLALRVPIAVFDPRVEQALDDRLLGMVSARGGGVRARELAHDLGLPLRTVQAALQRLVDEGECVREGEGARIEYRVEDTTFREPTRF